MRIITLLFFFCSLAFGAQALPVTISGTVTDTDGNPVEGVTIHIATDSSTWDGYFNQVLTDMAGQYSDTFEVPANQTQGLIYVSMVDCDGSYQLETTYWSPAGAGTVDFTYCEPVVVDTFCYVLIESELLASGGWQLTAVGEGVAPFSYSWVTGETGSSIVVEDPGTYCVSVTAADGCSSTDCVTIQQTGGCGVQIGLNPAGSLTAFPSGVPPFTYFWSTSETTGSIFPNTDGLYCVTVTDNEGCEATSCIEVNTGTGQDSCSVTIELVQGGTFLFADAGGTAPYTYFWSSGQNTFSIMPSQSGTYCVTVVDAVGCESTDCFVFGTPDPDNYQLSGFIYYLDSTDNVLSGSVYLFGLTPIGGLEPLDTTEIVNGGHYSFGDVDAGSYVIRAVLHEDDPHFADYLPTYYGNVLLWDEASTIIIPYSGFHECHVILQEAQEPEGPGVVSGTVIEGPGFTSDEEVDDRDDTPIEAVSILLMDENGLPLGYRLTDANGAFSFESLAWGTYQLIVEIPGLNQTIYWVTIGPDQPEVTNIIFVVTDEGVTTTGTEEWLQDTEVIVYPQPAGDQVQIRFDLPESTLLQIQIMDSTGKVIQQQTTQYESGQQNMELNTSQWPQGLYFYTFRAGQQLLSGKLIKG